MTSNAIGALKSDLESAKPNLNSSKDTPKGQAIAEPAGSPQSWAPDWTYGSSTTVASAQTESLYMKYTSRDGDVLELTAESSEVSYSSETASYSGTARARGAGRDEGNGLPAFSASAQAGQDVSGAEDPQAKQTAGIRAWAKQVVSELRQQQHKLMEQVLKQSGKHVDSGDGKFLLVYSSTTVQSADGKQADPSQDEPQVPPYWNAENTSDRIVNFATQMAKISGLDLKEFAAKIRDAIGAGFDQAKQATGELPGAAGKLNKDTRDLVFSKLSKWLEAQGSEAYNQKTRSNAISTAEVPDGTENNQQ